MRRLALAIAIVPFLVAGAGSAAHADTSTTAAYRQAVDAAYDIVVHATAGDVQAALHATSVLVSGTGSTQPEVVADLAQRPPDFNDAAARLKALLDAIDHPASTADPAAAQAKLHDVLAMHQYDALHRPPSALDRLSQWIGDRIKEIVSFLFGGNSIGGVIPTWTVYAIGALLVGAVAVVVFRSTRGRFSGEFASLVPTGPRAPADYFADADRLAARGDRVAALRALCAGVAATLAGERTWEGSPLTVREIFQRAPDPAALRPLLLPFEAAVYGGRDVDAAAYERAAAVASRFRIPAEKAA